MVPHPLRWTRRRHSAKLAAALFGVIALTLAVGALFTVHVLRSGDADTVSRDAAVAGLTGLSIVFFAHLGVVGIVLGGNVSLALGRLADRAERIGAGDLDVDLETDRIDEVGRLYRSFAEMRDSLDETLDDLERERRRAIDARRESERRNEELNAEAERFGEVMAACADGDLTRRLDPQTDNEAMRSVARSFNGMVDDLEAILEDVTNFATQVDRTSTDLQESAAEIRRASQEVSESIQEISDGSSQQTADLETASSEVEDLSASIEEVAATAGAIAIRSRELADSAATGRRRVGTATDEMHDAEERIAAAVETIERLNSDADQIEEIVRMIDDVAEQTNRLALNATIEASRSSPGDDEGFGVVAEEVQELAGETREAVDEVEATLGTIRDRAATGAEEVRAAEGSIDAAAETVEDLRGDLDEIGAAVETVDEGVQEIDRATSDQAESAQELATIVEDVAGVSSETTGQAERVAAASEEATATIGEVEGDVEALDEQADRLAEAVSVFDVGDPAAERPIGGEPT